MIYLDNAASTPLCDEARYPFENPANDYNPSGIYAEIVKDKIEIARAKILSKFTNSEKDMLIFTGSGTEANNLALSAVAANFPKTHIIASCIEHSSVLNTLQMLKYKGEIKDYTLVPVDENGFVTPAAIERAVRPDTSCICVMAANNEIGTIQPLEKIALLCYTHNIVCMTDATQALPQIRIGSDKEKLIDAGEIGIDIITFSAHKFHGPMGIGGVYMRRWLEQPYCFMGGGHQEYRMRPGTENVPAIIGMASAMEKIVPAANTELRDYLIDSLLAIPGVQLNGSRENRLPYNVNVRLYGLSGETQAMILHEKYGICVGTGSACNNGGLNPSHVLKSIGLTDEQANSSIRISLSDWTTKEEIDEFIKAYRTMVEVDAPQYAFLQEQQ